MKIATFIMCHNEEKLLPYTLRHYLTFSEVTVLENNSTDNSVGIARKMGAKVWDIHCPDVMDDYLNRNAKNNCWKISTADWVIVVDADEFVYCPNIHEVLERTQATIIRPQWFEMYSDKFPTTQGQIYEEVRMGHLGGAKKNLFKRTEIHDINYTSGSHHANPEGNVLIEDSTEIKTLHFRHLGVEAILERNRSTGSRLSENNIRRGLSYHFNYPEEQVRREYEEGLKLCKLVL